MKRAYLTGNLTTLKYIVAPVTVPHTLMVFQIFELCSRLTRERGFEISIYANER